MNLFCVNELTGCGGSLVTAPGSLWVSFRYHTTWSPPLSCFVITGVAWVEALRIFSPRFRKARRAATSKPRKLRLLIVTWWLVCQKWHRSDYFGDLEDTRINTISVRRVLFAWIQEKLACKTQGTALGLDKIPKRSTKRSGVKNLADLTVTAGSELRNFALQGHKMIIKA